MVTEEWAKTISCIYVNTCNSISLYYRKKITMKKNFHPADAGWIKKKDLSKSGDEEDIVETDLDDTEENPDCIPYENEKKQWFFVVQHTKKLIVME